MADKPELSKEQIVELIKARRPELLREYVEPGYIEDEELMAILAEALTPPPMIAGELLSTGFGPAMPQPRDVDLDGLIKAAGLVYHDHVQRLQRRPDGTDGLMWQRTERPMTGADVLAWQFDGDAVVVVTKDGQKLRFDGGGQAQNLLEG
jgi:hypothetical protein